VLPKNSIPRAPVPRDEALYSRFDVIAWSPRGASWSVGGCVVLAPSGRAVAYAVIG
jgi:hypothetical protein